ncbi:MAG: transglutaminase-like domain-containing protein [Verrucomicrobiae bacterium]|nr:transglutaminase-like domain-containing protein [Verrucomicrobiae bacterium]NNJ43503.1 transglutaminase domain-containing protein [Akkermansiaceae bacterium]
MSTSPPRLLTGTALLFWGGLSGHALAGLLAALLVEASAWLNLRWDFKREFYVKAWQFSILCGALVGILAWLNGVRAGHIHSLFVWAPLILLPLELAQRYGNATKIPLNTFSFFARRKMVNDIHHGRAITPRMLNIGYPYIMVVTLATAMASRNELQHFIGLSLVIGACLFFSIRKKGFRPWAWGCALLLVLSLSVTVQWGMLKLYYHFTGSQPSANHQRHSPNESRTSIGRLGRLKLSPRIFWRMQVHDDSVPQLLRTATYNEYARARWSHRFIPSLSRDDYDYLDPTTMKVSEERSIYTFSSEDNIPSLGKENMQVIGELDAGIKENPIPLPHFTFALGDLGEEAGIECNSLGTVRMHNAEFNVIEYSIWTGESSTTEEPPNAFDLHIPDHELHAIRRIGKHLKLHHQNLSTRQKIAILRDFFNTQFTYTTHLNTPRFDRGKRQSAVGIFLETSRAGHCEYFATATALLLREAGVPSRYCIGFSVNEHDPTRNEWIMRGQHAHAWCRVWIQEHQENNKRVAGHWEDLDLTPASWPSAESATSSTWQRQLTDTWQRWREDFLIWRTRDTNKSKVIVTITLIISLLSLWIIWRLWQSRQRHTRSIHQRYQRPQDAPLTALHKIEPLAAKKIGPRPEGTPLCRWLSDLLQVDPSLEGILLPAIRLHSIIRFDPHGATPEQYHQLTRQTAALRQAIKRKPTQGHTDTMTRPS